MKRRAAAGVTAVDEEDVVDRRHRKKQTREEEEDDDDNNGDIEQGGSDEKDEEDQDYYIVPRGFEITAHPIFKTSARRRRSAEISRTIASPWPRHRVHGKGKSGGGEVEEEQEESHRGGKKGDNDESVIIRRVPSFHCAICTDVLLSPVVCLPCRHLFCADCIVRWFRVSRQCPLCKTSVKRLWYNVNRDERNGIEEKKKETVRILEVENDPDFHFWCRRSNPYLRRGITSSSGRLAKTKLMVEGQEEGGGGGKEAEVEGRRREREEERRITKQELSLVRTKLKHFRQVLHSLPYPCLALRQLVEENEEGGGGGGEEGRK